MTPEAREILRKWLAGDRWLIDEIAVGMALRHHYMTGDGSISTQRIKPEEFYQMPDIDQQKTTIRTALWALERAEVILSNMAQENTGWWASLFSRWAISDEPLRNDAAAALPEISRAIERLREEKPDGRE